MPSTFGVVASAYEPPAALASGQAFSDDFNRPDGALGPNWELFTASGTQSGIVTNRWVGNDAGENHQTALWVTPTDTTDCYAQVDWDADGGETFGPVICGDGTVSGGYRSKHYNWYDRLYIERNGTQVAEVQVGGLDLWHTLRLERTGDTVRLLLDGVERLTYTDATPLTGRRVGMGMRNTTGMRMDNWAAGDL